MWSGIDNLHSEQNKEVTNSPCTSYHIAFGLLLTANNPATNNNWNGTYLIQIPKTMFFRIFSSLSPTRSINAALYITDFHLQFSAQCVAHINKMCYFCTRNNKGEVLEWLKRHAWKACIRLKRIGGSNPPLSANKGVNQWVTWFTPFITPQNVRLNVFYLDSHKHSFNCKKEWWTIFFLCASPTHHSPFLSIIFKLSKTSSNQRVFFNSYPTFLASWNMYLLKGNTWFNSNSSLYSI